MTKRRFIFAMLAILGMTSIAVSQIHTYEVVEESFTAEKSYDNPFIDVDLWVDLSGPDWQQIRIPAFWDGEQTFRVRMMGTAPGTWSWSTGKRTGDSGLDGKHGSFSVSAWNEREKAENPNRRGIIRVAANGRTLEYPDGKPFFLTGDTCYSALTKIYSWSSAVGKAGLSLQDYIVRRKAQGFNSIAIISCFPSDTKVKLWQASLCGEKIAEDGSTPFEMHSDTVNPANFLRINPAYFQLADRKMQYLWDSGFVPLLETVRRHEKWYQEDPEEKAAFTNFVRYLWARWGCYNMIFDWLHWDNDPSVYASWLPMVRAAHETLGGMPYGTPKTAMSYITCLTSWYKDVPQALEINNISNWPRTTEQFDHQIDLFNVTPPVPTLNIEPFYPGWNHPPSGGLTHTEFAMLIAYGSVLNGGLAGHVWGDIYWGGVATRTYRAGTRNYSDQGVDIAAAEPHVIGMNKFKAGRMGNLKAFILDTGHDYRKLKPATFTHLEDHQDKTIALAINDCASEALGFVAARRPESVLLKDFPANREYTLQWWDIDKGLWQGETVVSTSATGTAQLLATPDKNRSWAFRLLQHTNGATVTIAIDTTSAPVLFGAEITTAALGRLDMSPVVVDHRAADGSENIWVDIVQPGEDPQIKKEGFRLENSSGRIVVSAIDSTGAMYGLMELAEQIDLQEDLSKVETDLQNPRFPFRAIKFNLPWSSYRRFSALQVNEPLCRDLDMWEAFLDMMAENRFNALTLWNMHPFPYLIRAKNFPKATPFSDEELAQWKVFWTTLFKMAKDRGIESYLVNWNVFVSEEFKKHYDAAGVSDMEKFLGDIENTETIRKYTRESITQVINEYPDLTGLGVTLGERMQNLDSEQQTDWVEDVFFHGIKEADRPIKFIYRAALKGDHAVHRATIDNSGLPEPIWVELKFNWSHGHSTPTLVKAHGGGTGEEYWTNPAPSKHKMCWMIRNEDFFRLRWGEPDFVRAHIAQNGQDFVGGYFVGSETMIPAKDIFHKPNHKHVNWKYAFQRQWLFYKEWGRLLYNPETPDAVFSNAFDVRYEGGHGGDMVEAFKLSTRTNQRILSFFRVAQDATNYAEGFLGLRKFLTVRDVMNSTPTDPHYVSVEEFVKGSGDFGGRLTPIELATALEADAGKALTLVNGISTTEHTLECEIEDVKAWSHLGLHFAKKLRAAVAVIQKDKAKAIKYITQAQQHWVDLVSVTEAHFLPGFVYGEKRGGGQGLWHWSAYQDEVDADVQ